MIEKSSYPILGLLALVSLISYPFLPVLSLALLVFAIFTIYFFRDPERKIGAGIVSPADGKIIYLDKNRMDIFMSPFDCHVNRAPIGGVVKSVRFFKGKKPPAFIRRGDVCRNEIVIETELGTFKVTQVAGIFARRIVCYVKEGEKVEKGQKIGIIKFGSRVVLEVPDGFKFIRKVGEKIKAGESVAVYENSKDSGSG
ncbi:MAG: phosphatidylserine decarboxylase [Archaeoglobales archaeon]|nr:phosphatidylserine decarboxylase [Archaeoglobales archaeon]